MKVHWLVSQFSLGSLRQKKIKKILLSSPTALQPQLWDTGELHLSTLHLAMADSWTLNLRQMLYAGLTAHPNNTVQAPWPCFTSVTKIEFSSETPKCFNILTSSGAMTDTPGWSSSHMIMVVLFTGMSSLTESSAAAVCACHFPLIQLQTWCWRYLLQAKVSQRFFQNCLKICTWKT